MIRSQSPTWRTIKESFLTTHCQNCEYGWTRRGPKNEQSDQQPQLLIVCLLDREPVKSEMTDCDRYCERGEQADPLEPREPS